MSVLIDQLEVILRTLAKTIEIGTEPGLSLREGREWLYPGKRLVRIAEQLLEKAVQDGEGANPRVVSARERLTNYANMLRQVLGED